MATENTAAKDERANDFASDFAAAILVIKDGTSALATHTLNGFGSPSSGTITASSISDETNAASGTADNATLTAGTKVYTLTVSGVGGGGDLELNNLNYVAGGISSVSSFSVSF